MTHLMGSGGPPAALRPLLTDAQASRRGPRLPGGPRSPIAWVFINEPWYYPAVIPLAGVEWVGCSLLKPAENHRAWDCSSSQPSEAAIPCPRDMG